MTAVVITGMAGVRAPSLAALPDPLRTRAARSERVTQLAFSAAQPALAMAGLATTEGDPRPRLGAVLGTAFGCFLTNAAYQRRVAEGGPAAASPRLFAATVSNAAAGELAIAYRLGGPAITLTAGSVAGLVAIAHAVDLLAMGHADACLAGGMDAVDDALERWVAAGGLSATIPLCEGAGFLVLERAEHAARRGARAVGRVVDTRVSFLPQASGGRAPQSFAAAGPFAVSAALERVPVGSCETVAEHCPSGHAAAVTVERLR